MVYKPSWFCDGSVIISNAPTCGVNKDGLEQFSVDSGTGMRSETIDDRLYEDVLNIKTNNLSRGSIDKVELEKIYETKIAVPKYYEHISVEQINKEFSNNDFFILISLKELKEEGFIELFNGHGSPSADQRIGDIPYIKVSDLRAGQVNINPSNLIPRQLAENYWKGYCSKLKAYDLISPERASKNIGEFCVLMPGQENIVLTKEVIIIRSTEKAPFTQFYLMWALSLSSVRKQWERVILMQTNREDVGSRYEEIIIPVPKNNSIMADVANPFEQYYKGLYELRTSFIESIESSLFQHHIYFE